MKIFIEQNFDDFHLFVSRSTMETGPVWAEGLLICVTGIPWEQRAKLQAELQLAGGRCVLT